MDDPLTSGLSKRTRLIIERLGQYGSIEALKQADPTITELELQAAERESADVLGIFGRTPEEAMKNFMAEIEAGVERRKRRARGTRSAFQFKITLVRSKPPIWRRFVVPFDITLQVLHQVIQDVMGWTDSHLHEFQIDGEAYGGRSPFGDPLESDALDEADYLLEDLVQTEKSTLNYTYDFGDGWEHRLILEAISPAAECPSMFTCLAGKGNCPPEDCGGLWGYYEMVEAIKNPRHPRHDELAEWLGDDFDPDAFDIGSINKQLAWYRRKRRKK